MAATSTISQSIDAARWARVGLLADRLGVPKSRLLDEILSAENLELVVDAIRKPAQASQRLDTIQTMQQGQEIGEAVVRYLETRDDLLNPRPHTDEA